LLAALALAGACLGGLPAVALAIPVAYALRFAIALCDRRARQVTRREAAALPIELPSPFSFSDEGARALVERLGRARCAIENALLTSPGGAAFALTGLVDDIPQLERDVVVLAARLEYLGRFLSSAPSTGLASETAQLDEDREKETDATTREAFERLVARCRAHLDTLKGLELRRNASFRRAEEVLRTLEQIPAQIVSLQLARVESCDVRCLDSGRRSEAMSDGFVALEREISLSAPDEALSMEVQT
jgi:hypothetical protein